MIAVAEPIDADTLRIRHEFLAQPDLSVSADIVAVMLALPLRHALIILESLVSEHFLTRTANGQYRRSFRERNREKVCEGFQAIEHWQ